MRGSPIESYGSMDLLLRDAGGEPQRIMQADESVYLHPAQARLPGPAAVVVGEDDFPDVVLEVDTPPTCGAASSVSMSRGDFRKCGWTCVVSQGKSLEAQAFCSD